MTTTTSTPDLVGPCPAMGPGRHASIVHGRPLPVLVLVALGVVAVTAILTIVAGPAGAQTSTSLTPPTTLPAENPGSTAAGVVFFGVTAVIIVGALVLYLRNRRPSVPTPGD